jgi:hypothetical protein
MKKRLAAVGLSVFMLSVSGFFSAALAAPVCDRQLVMRIDTLKKSVEPDGISIDAFGVAESLGWKSPVLIVTGIAGGVANVDFTACRPEVSAQALTPIQVHQVLDLDLATTQRIIIRTRDNSMTVEISQ